jgi:dCMP deaminase
MLFNGGVYIFKMENKRPSKDEYYSKIALQVAQRGTCLRRNHGAVIVKNDQIISTGYSGAPRGTPNCADIGTCYRDLKGFKPGEHYEKCRSVHAEANAIIHAARADMIGATLYLSGFHYKTGKLNDAKACKMCRRMMINAGISRAVYLTTKGLVSENVEDWVKRANQNPFEELDEEGY